MAGRDSKAGSGSRPALRLRDDALTTTRQGSENDQDTTVRHALFEGAVAYRALNTSFPWLREFTLSAASRRREQGPDPFGHSRSPWPPV